jgi:hypothetical protein
MPEDVTRSLWVAGFNLAPGQVHHWVQDGQTYGKLRWFLAYPLQLAGVDRAVEIERVFTRVRANGERRIEVLVRNIGTTVANYGIFVAQTSGP